jgi:hypothetical protein
MDVMVVLEDRLPHSPVLAHVNSVPSPLHSGQPTREVVTLYGEASSASLAIALAAAVEGQRDADGGSSAMRHLGVWPERGAVGDSAWRDVATGRLMARDLDIPFTTLQETARLLLSECGQLIGRLVAGLSMPDWPEGSRRAINFSMTPSFAVPAASGATVESMLAALRETDGQNYDFEGD